MVQLKTEQQFKWGQKNIIPIVGLVEISPEGIIEVETQEIADQIIAIGIGFEIHQSGSTTTLPQITTQEQTTTTTTIQSLAPKTEQDELGDKGEQNSLNKDDEKDELFKSLETKTITELQELAKPFAVKDWTGLNKAKLIDYLKSKI